MENRKDRKVIGVTIDHKTLKVTYVNYVKSLLGKL